MLLMDSFESEETQHHHTKSIDVAPATPMKLLLQRRGGQNQELPRRLGKRPGRCFHLQQTLLSIPWPLRLVLLVVTAAVVVALGAAAAQTQRLDTAALGLGQEAGRELLLEEEKRSRDEETGLHQQHLGGVEGQTTLLQDGLPRLPRSPVSPPTVTSLQPHRRGVSKAMHDTSLAVGRQSEGPSHPSLMRKTPPRRLADTLLPLSDAVARPHTMVHLPQEAPMDLLLAEAASLQGGPHHSNYYAGYPLQYESGAERYYVQTEYDDAGDYGQQPQQYAGDIQRMNSKIARDAEDENRSRQRRVDNSFQGLEDERNLARHGRFGEVHGGRLEASQGQQRHDTFGHAISEELWTGPRRSSSSSHPAARGVSTKTRAPASSDDNSIWSRQSSSHGFRWPRTHHASTAQTTLSGRRGTAGGATRDSGQVLFHPGSKMSSRGSVTRSESPFNRETVVIQETGNRRAKHPRMFRPMLNNGASVNENEEVLEFSKSSQYPESTTIPSISQTIDPLVWGQWLNQETEEQNREIESVNNHPVEIDRRPDGDPYFSDPIYAMGVHPISEEVETFHETFSDVTADEDSQAPYQPSNYSYEDYYSDEEDDAARIESFTIHEIPSESTFDDDKRDHINAAHPHYDPLDQVPRQPINGEYVAANDKLTSSANNDVQTKSILSEQGGWGLQKSSPLSYAVIAAGAIMGSLAVFTLFVLIAYSIVKCTKKPMLNNYQVSDKKPVEITA